MNDEIFKRLQDQCWIYNTHPDMIDDKGRPCGFDTKKFAELIVAECVELLYQRRKPISNDLTYAQGWLDGRTSGVELIEKHFGVE